MGRSINGNEIDLLIEELAAIEHERWAHWQKYMHAQGKKSEDGSLLIPAHLVTRWEQQITKKYEELTEKERQSDREQVMKYFPLIERWLKVPNQRN